MKEEKFESLGINRTIHFDNMFAFSSKLQCNQ